MIPETLLLHALAPVPFALSLSKGVLLHLANPEPALSSAEGQAKA